MSFIFGETEAKMVEIFYIADLLSFKLPDALGKMQEKLIEQINNTVNNNPAYLEELTSVISRLENNILEQLAEDSHAST